ncbi:MAG: hypothetical protein ORN28_04770, partial [Rhodoferax sp.]|nr:hypothetical protein [Rhodoferax sp.]
MQALVLLRDKSGPASWLRQGLQGHAVYRLTHCANGDWAQAIPCDASALAAWLLQLAAAGFGVLWLPSSASVDGTGYGCFLHKAAELQIPALPTASLTEPIHTMAAQAVACGLRLMLDRPRKQAPEDGVQHQGQALHAKYAEYRWSESTQTLLGQAHRAASIHCTLSHFYRASSKVWPLWMLPADSEPSTGNKGTLTADIRLLQLLRAISVCLHGSPIWNHTVAGETPGIPNAISHFLRWRQTVPALLRGKMRLLGVHEHLLMFIRKSEAQSVLCVFNVSDRYVRHALPVHSAGYCLIAGSGLDGGRIVNGHIDCDPWG